MEIIPASAELIKQQLEISDNVTLSLTPGLISYNNTRLTRIKITICGLMIVHLM
jgi:hypothetical protein